VSAPLRVALLHPTYWPEVRRGAERLVHDVAAGLAARGHEPCILTSHDGATARSEEGAITVVRHRRLPDGLLRRRALQDHLTHLPFVARTLARERFDVVHAFHPSDALVALRGGQPSVLTLVGLPRGEALANRWLRPQALERAVFGSDELVTISAAAQAAAQRWLGRGGRVIHPGTDVAVFARDRERAPGPVLFCPSALDDPRKRPELLLGAFELVRGSHPDARLVLSRPADPAAAARLTAPGVELVDVDGEAALVRSYSAASATVLTSEAEAFGLVLVESLACGTPVVASADAAGPEIIDRPGIGALFEDPSAEAVAAAIFETLTLADPGSACRARAEELSVQRCAAEHEALYEQLVRRRRDRI
jgi:glycosyltransferase involved in cell wall biosynthesis